MTMAKHANMSKMVSVTNLSTYNVLLFKESCDLVTREQWEKKNAEFEVGGGDRDTFAEQSDLPARNLLNGKLHSPLLPSSSILGLSWK